MSPAEQTYHRAVDRDLPYINTLQAMASDTRLAADTRERHGQRALAMRAELHRLRVEAANG